jgi:hypothetical protein
MKRTSMNITLAASEHRISTTGDLRHCEKPFLRASEKRFIRQSHSRPCCRRAGGAVQEIPGHGRERKCTARLSKEEK